MESVLATGHSITVVCTPGNPLATWSTNGATPATIKANKGDTISFTIDTLEEEVVQAQLFSGPANQQTAGYLFGKDPVDVTKKVQLNVGQNAGIWGFAIAIETQKDGVSSFYFLPDPELEVDSTGGI